MKNLLAVLAICSCLLTVARAAPSSTPVFQIHLVDTTPTSTSEEMTLASKVQNVRVNVQKEILMDEKGVKSASVRTGEQGQTQIEIVFTDAGKKRFAEITRQNIGRQLAIIIDGRLY